MNLYRVNFTFSQVFQTPLHTKLLLSGIQLDRKESLDQPYLEQQTKALLPNKELYLEKITLYRELNVLDDY